MDTTILKLFVPFAFPFRCRLMFRKVTSSAVFETVYIHHLLEGKLNASTQHDDIARPSTCY